MTLCGSSVLVPLPRYVNVLTKASVCCPMDMDPIPRWWPLLRSRESLVVRDRYFFVNSFNPRRPFQILDAFI